MTADSAFWPHTGVVLAGGRSVRMGRPKEDLILPDGRGMAETVADALANMVGVVVVAGKTSALGDHQHLPDLRPDQGPLGGIEALLASGLDTEYLVVPCDLPLITPEILHLLTRPAQAPATVLRVEGEDDSRPLPTRISAAVLPIVREQLDAGKRSVRGVLERIDTEVVDVPAALALQLENVNTPEDLARVWIAATEG